MKTQIAEQGLNAELHFRNKDPRKVALFPHPALLPLVVDSVLGGVPREQKMLKGHLPSVIYHPVF